MLNSLDAGVEVGFVVLQLLGVLVTDRLLESLGYPPAKQQDQQTAGENTQDCVHHSLPSST